MEGPRSGAADALLPSDPDRVGPYEISGRLGQGGMGAVYLGRGPDGRRVAIKVIRPELARDPGFIARFEDEVANAQRVASFCTAQVLDHGTDDGRAYMATEYIDGVALLEYVRENGALSPGMLHGVAVGVAAALVAIHSAGLIHRDLKPANVLLSLSGPRVIDFGIARALDAASAHTLTGQLIGSPGWMAPEQIRVEQITTAADIFAWGCLVAYAGNGSHPYGQGDFSLLAYRITMGEVDPNAIPALPAPLNHLVARALDVDPARRPTARDLLLALVGGEGESAVLGTLNRSWTTPPADQWTPETPGDRPSPSRYTFPQPSAADPDPAPAGPGTWPEAIPPAGDDAPPEPPGRRQGRHRVGAAPQTVYEAQQPPGGQPAGNVPGGDEAATRPPGGAMPAAGYGAGPAAYEVLRQPPGPAAEHPVQAAHEAPAQPPGGRPAEQYPAGAMPAAGYEFAQGAWPGGAPNAAYQAPAAMRSESPEAATLPANARGGYGPAEPPGGSRRSLVAAWAGGVALVVAAAVAAGFILMKPLSSGAKTGTGASGGSTSSSSSGPQNAGLVRGPAATGWLYVRLDPPGAPGQCTSIIARTDPGNDDPKPVKVPAGGYCDVLPQFSPDHTLIAFTRNKGAGGHAELWVMWPDGSHPHLVTNMIREGTRAAWSPDETQLAFTSNTDPPQLYRVASTGKGTPQKVTSDPAGASSVSWSVDGRHLAFSSGASGTTQIYSLDLADPAKWTQLSHAPVRATNPSWSRDGKLIAFTYGKAGSSNIWVMNADGSNPRPVTKTDSNDQDPCWSPDGTSIAFGRGPGKGPQIWAAHVDGGGLHKITKGGRTEGHPAW